MGPLLDVFNISGVGLMDINGSKPNDVFFNENQIFLEFHLGPQDGDISWSENPKRIWIDHDLPMA